MRVLQIVPIYPGGRHDGSAVYHRSLNGALRRRGIEISVACTRTDRLQHALPFLIRWPTELPRRALEDGISVRRFRSVDLSRAGSRLSAAVTRRWSREDMADGRVLEGSLRYVESAVGRARTRPSRFDLCADLGRGPLSPGLVAHVACVARRYDVILAGYAPFYLARQVQLAVRLLNTPVVLLPFIHETDPYHHFSSLYDTYSRAAAVLTLSDHTAEFLRRCVPGAHPVAIGAGMTTLGERLDAAAVKAFRERHDLRGRRILLFVGRKEPGKRYDLAIAAVERLPEDVVLVMIGQEVDNQTITSRRVRYLGTVSDADLVAAYGACEVFVFPSEHESFGMVFLDAWRQRKPVVGNAACGAAAALIEDGQDGYLRRDADGFASAVKGLLDDPALAASLGQRGFEKTLGNYTWDRVADRALDVLEAVVERRPVTVPA